MARVYSALVNSDAHDQRATLRDALLAMQNDDGGWGLVPGKRSNLTDTILVLDALLRDELLHRALLREEAGDDDVAMIPLVEPSVYTAARAYLLPGQLIQNSGENMYDAGSWPMGQAPMPSDLGRTAQVVRLLQLTQRVIGSTPASVKAVDRAVSYLERPENSDAYGGNRDRALALLAKSLVFNAAELQDDVAKLTAAQRPDGSWDSDGSGVGDVVTTALVLRALKAAQPPPHQGRPDLMIVADRITVTTEGGNAPVLPRHEDVIVRAKQ
jgi:hypothetical protein